MICAARPVAVMVFVVLIACSTVGCGGHVCGRVDEPATVGDNLYARGEPEFLDQSRLGRNTVQIDDLWKPGSTKSQYRVDGQVFDTVELLLGHLRDADPAALKGGLLLALSSKAARPDFEQDLAMLCSFAEERNVDLFMRTLSSKHLPGENPISWLVKRTPSPQPEDEGAKMDGD